MYGRTNAGGGINPFAFIFATYPAGSVCTCTDGSRTLKLKDTSGYGAFCPPYAGTWTVTATDGDQTKSETVEITKEGQSVSVELNYLLYIIKNGVEQVPVSINDGNKSNANGVFKVYRDGSSPATYANFGPVNLSKYKTLRIQVTGVLVNDSYDNFIGVAASPNSTSTAAKLKVTRGNSGAKSINVSSLSGNYYILFRFEAGGGETRHISASNMWLEP